MALVGYARVSTEDQSLDLQLDALTAAGCGRVFAERLSGRTAEGRPELQACLAALGTGDVLCVTKLDRVARSLNDLTSIMADLLRRGVGFRCLDQAAVDTTTVTGRLMLNILGAVAEFERELILDRSRAGIARAKAAGKYRGRPRPRKVEEALELKRAGVGAREAAGRLGVTERTVYRLWGAS
jgi:DNA invertase Pin-like site-specific DNA recombinase